MRRQCLEIAKHHHRFRTEKAGRQLAQAQGRVPAPIKPVAGGLGIKHRQVEPDIVAKDQTIRDMRPKPRHHQRQLVSACHHLIRDAMDSGAGSRDRHARLDECRKLGKLVLRLDGTDLDNPVRACTKPRRLEIE